MLHVLKANGEQGARKSSFPRMRIKLTYLRLRDWYLVHHTHTPNARDKFIATPHSSEDKLKFWKNDWEFCFIAVNSEREIQLFPPEKLKHAFLFSRKLQFRRYRLLSSFDFPTVNTINQVKKNGCLQRKCCAPGTSIPLGSRTDVQQSSASFSEKNRLKTWLSWPNTNRTMLIALSWII
jgi:hypothetical protein